MVGGGGEIGGPQVQFAQLRRRRHRPAHRGRRGGPPRGKSVGLVSWRDRRPSPMGPVRHDNCAGRAPCGDLRPALAPGRVSPRCTGSGHALLLLRTGSPLFLKEHFGVGFRLTASKTPPAAEPASLSRGAPRPVGASQADAHTSAPAP